MYCGKCGNEILEDDKFCRNCGTPINEKVVNTNTNQNNNTVLDDTHYTIATKVNPMKNILKVIGLIGLAELAALMKLFENPPAFFTASSTIIGIGVVFILICLSLKEYIGDCPYCGCKVKTANTVGFICPRCRKNVAVKDNKFMKIKD